MFCHYHLREKKSAFYILKKIVFFFVQESEELDIVHKQNKIRFYFEWRIQSISETYFIIFSMRWRAPGTKSIVHRSSYWNVSLLLCSVLCALCSRSLINHIKSNQIWRQMETNIRWMECSRVTDQSIDSNFP